MPLLPSDIDNHNVGQVAGEGSHRFITCVLPAVLWFDIYTHKHSITKGGVR